MSLKAFHKFFIVAAAAICGWLSRSEYLTYGQTQLKASLYTSLATGFLAAAMAVYVIWFWMKSRDWPET